MNTLCDGEDHVRRAAEIFGIGGQVDIVVGHETVGVPRFFGVVVGYAAPARAGAGVHRVGEYVHPENVLTGRYHDLTEVILYAAALVEQLLAGGWLDIEQVHDLVAVIGAQTESREFVKVSIYVQRHLVDELLHVLCGLFRVVIGEPEVPETDDENARGKDEHRYRSQQLCLYAVVARGFLQSLFHPGPLQTFV